MKRLFAILALACGLAAPVHAQKISALTATNLPPTGTLFEVSVPAGGATFVSRSLNITNLWGFTNNLASLPALVTTSNGVISYVSTGSFPRTNVSFYTVGASNIATFYNYFGAIGTTINSNGHIHVFGTTVSNIPMQITPLTGGTNNSFQINGTNGVPAMWVGTNGFLMFTDATYDIGGTSATFRPRNIFGSGNTTMGGNGTFGASSSIGWNNRSTMQSTINGSIVLYNFAANAYSKLTAATVQYAGHTNAWASTVVLDMSTNAFQELVVTNSFTLGATNYANGRAIKFLMRPTNYSTNYIVTLDSSFQRYGAGLADTNLAATTFLLVSNKNAKFELESWGTTSADLHVLARTQQ